MFEHSFLCIWPSFCLHLEVPGHFVIWHNFWLKMVDNNHNSNKLNPLKLSVKSRLKIDWPWNALMISHKISANWKWTDSLYKAVSITFQHQKSSLLIYYFFRHHHSDLASWVRYERVVRRTKAATEKKAPKEVGGMLAARPKGQLISEANFLVLIWSKNKRNCFSISALAQSYIYQVLQTIQMKLILLCVWAEPAVLGSAKMSLKFIYKI